MTGSTGGKFRSASHWSQVFSRAEAVDDRGASMRSRLPKRRMSHLRKEGMSSYDQTARERKRARVLFLELRAEGFELLA